MNLPKRPPQPPPPAHPGRGTSRTPPQNAPEPASKPEPTPDKASHPFPFPDAIPGQGPKLSL